MMDFPHRRAHEATKPISLWPTARQWWKDAISRNGLVATSRQLVLILWEFARDSSPSRKRQRYGDVGYDWDYRVNTTSAGVGWRERLLGAFHSPYQPTDAALFHEMMNALQRAAKIDFGEFIFIDLGSGKGRALLMASDYPFREIVGVELLPALHATARQNLSAYHSESQKCFNLESICTDARGFIFPGAATVLFLFNPFPEAALRAVIANLEKSLQLNPRAVYVLYHNPLLEHVLGESSAFVIIGGPHQYAMYASR